MRRIVHSHSQPIICVLGLDYVTIFSLFIHLNAEFCTYPTSMHLQLLYSLLIVHYPVVLDPNDFDTTYSWWDLKDVQVVQDFHIVLC